MSTRVAEVVALVVLLAVLLLLASASLGTPASTASTFDTGPNGYRALYDVLQREGIPLSRLQGPLGTLDPAVRVLAVTDGAYDANDLQRLRAFMDGGGWVVAFGAIANLGRAPHLRVFDVRDYTNLALSKTPQRALAVYRALAGRGPVAFDERVHGYDRTQSLWAVLPRSVHIAVGLATLAVVLALIDANVPFTPPLVREPPGDRDSSDYVRSMATLLRRAHAGAAAIERFARAYPKSAELRELAAVRHPSEALVLRAAAIYAAQRKEHA
ncbi:MAG TPA: DUF4350 domain-containing protein [Candidatus Baltobacteraceae bacterium]|nr:DUF4350 domain-containing protein [Candidatus Baltobacteraceae bacterium]